MGATTVGKLYQHPNGVFYAMSSTRITDIKDGTSTTIFMVETREPQAAVWIDGGTAAVMSHPYDETNPPDYALPQQRRSISLHISCRREGRGSPAIGDRRVSIRGASITCSVTVRSASFRRRSTSGSMTPLVTPDGQEAVESSDY